MEFGLIIFWAFIAMVIILAFGKSVCCKFITLNSKYHIIGIEHKSI
jgi:hypothetical protein